MPIPTSREQLVGMVESSFERLDDELSGAGPEIGGLHCVDDWTIKDLLAVRAWWTASVVEWIEEGRRGGCLRAGTSKSNSSNGVTET